MKQALENITAECAGEGAFTPADAVALETVLHDIIATGQK